MDEYVGNSHKQQKAEQHKAEKVIEGKVMSQPETTKSRLAKDAADIWDYAKNELIIPGMKSWVMDILDNALYGNRGGSRGGYRRDSRDRYYDYNRSYSRRDRERDRDRRDRDDRYRDRDRDKDSRKRKPDLNNIVLSLRDSERVLRDLRETIDEYDFATLSDLYSFIGYGEEVDHTDFSYGWYDLDMASTKYISKDKYLLRLPKPVPLD